MKQVGITALFGLEAETKDKCYPRLVKEMLSAWLIFLEGMLVNINNLEKSESEIKK